VVADELQHEVSDLPDHLNYLISPTILFGIHFLRHKSLFHDVKITGNSFIDSRTYDILSDVSEIYKCRIFIPGLIGSLIK
jgi:hypothetical protein